MTHTRRAILGMALAIPVVGSILRPALAAEPPFYAPDGLALGGADVMDYFDTGRRGGPIRTGLSAHEFTWRDVLWRFASPAHMRSFRSHPLAHVPRYGGYCALALAQGSIAASDPQVHVLMDGRLFLFRSADARAIWSRDRTARVGRADRNWPSVLKGQGGIT